MWVIFSFKSYSGPRELHVLTPAFPTRRSSDLNNKAQGLPPIDVSATQGKMLSLLAQVEGARRILEVGTLDGYSTIWLARALPEDGALVTLEIESEIGRAHV